MKHLFLILILVLSAFAMESVISIELSSQAKEFINKQSTKDQKRIEKAIGVGNQFTQFYLNGELIYDEEMKGQWIDQFGSISTMSNEKVNKIWRDNLGTNHQREISSNTTCNKIYIKEILFTTNTIKLTYETHVLGTNYEINYHYTNNKFIKLGNEYLMYELTLNQTPKVINWKFFTKNSRINDYQRFVYQIDRHIENITNNKFLSNNESLLNEYIQLKTDILKASDICKNY
jgi:hypothetical protein